MVIWYVSIALFLLYLAMRAYNILNEPRREAAAADVPTTFREGLQKSINGFVAELTGENAAKVAKAPRPDQQTILESMGNKTLTGEQRVRMAAEFLTGKPFPSTRPTWLRNPISQRLLQLDCYNEELALAIEYDGAQHTFFNPFFHQTWESFQYAQLRDNIKEELCKMHNVVLIRIPFWVVEQQKLLPYLRMKLLEAGYINQNNTLNSKEEARRCQQQQPESTVGGAVSGFSPPATSVVLTIKS